MKSFYPKAQDELVTKNWLIIDLKSKSLGRVTTEIARILMGKSKPTFTPGADTGDFVIAINSDKIRLTGRKWEQKVYYRHTGYMGGIRETTAQKQLEKDSTKIVTEAVKGMLPKNIFGRKLLGKLKVYKNDVHPHGAQKPQTLTLAS